MNEEQHFSYVAGMVHILVCLEAALVDDYPTEFLDVFTDKAIEEGYALKPTPDGAHMFGEAIRISLETYENTSLSDAASEVWHSFYRNFQRRAPEVPDIKPEPPRTDPKITKLEF